MLLGIMRLAILLLPFRRIARRLGPSDQESPLELTPQQRERALEVRWAIRAISSRTPWNSNCFPQALTALVLLRRRNVPCTLYLGARFSDGAEWSQGAVLRGHAWLRAGRIDICGGRAASGFGKLARYGAGAT